MIGSYWIGLSDSVNERTWLWLNGNRANPDDGSLWYPSYPLTGSTGNSFDCAYAHFGAHAGGISVFDQPCSYRFLALCEKPV